MAYDYSKLIGKIIEKYGTREAFAKAMGISDRTLYSKLRGEYAWDQDEIQNASTLLGIPIKNMHSYFFVPKVQKAELNR